MRRLALLALVAACSDAPPTREVVSMPGVPWPALDVLIMMDDSPSSGDLQRALATWSDSLLDPLIAAAGTRDLHVGVATSDMGTGGAPPLGEPGSGGCEGAGKDGALRVNGAPVTGNFLVDSAAPNYTGLRQQAVASMVLAGEGGCAFEQPLAATARALDNPANAGFERPNANLLVIAIQNEDDCSTSGPDLFGDDPALGPLDSFRCTRVGVTCDEPLDGDGPKHNCHSAEDSAYLTPVLPIARGLRDRKPDPSRMVFAVIAGPAQPFSVVERTPPGGVPALALDHSCGWTGPDGLLVADPAVRMADAVDEVGVHGVFTIVCDQNLISQLAQIVSVAQQMFGIACLHEAAPHCTVTEERDGDARELSECPAADDCFEIVPDPDRCGTVNDLRLNVQYATPPTDTTYIRARCEVP